MCQEIVFLTCIVKDNAHTSYTPVTCAASQDRPVTARTGTSATI